MTTPYQQCLVCGKIVKINKPIFGSLHVCLPPEAVSQVRRNMQARMVNQNVNPLALTELKKLLKINPEIGKSAIHKPLVKKGL